MARIMEIALSRIREISSPSKGKKMHAVAEAHSLLRRGAPPLPEEKKGKWIERAAAVFGLTFSQAKKIVYGEVKDLRASRLDAMRDKLNQLKESANKRQGIA